MTRLSVAMRCKLFVELSKEDPEKQVHNVCLRTVDGKLLEQKPEEKQTLEEPKRQHTKSASPAKKLQHGGPYQKTAEEEAMIVQQPQPCSGDDGGDGGEGSDGNDGGDGDLGGGGDKEPEPPGPDPRPGDGEDPDLPPDIEIH